MTIQDLNDLSPFLAVIVSMLALSVGPWISGRVAHAHAVAAMREKWIYAFRDCLVELTTDLDVFCASRGEEGIFVDEQFEEFLRKLRAQENRVRLMVNTEERLYRDLIHSVEAAIDMVIGGVEDYDVFHTVNEQLKARAQQAIRDEWKKIAPQRRRSPVRRVAARHARADTGSPTVR